MKLKRSYRYGGSWTADTPSGHIIYLHDYVVEIRYVNTGLRLII